MRVFPDDGSVVLLAEDDPDQALLLKRAWKKTNQKRELIRFEDGEELVKFLARLSSPPSLMILDLNMPRMDGFETLTWIRKSARFENVPVLILTTSDREADKKRARELGASEYALKPASVAGLVSLVEDAARRWL